MQEKAKLFFFDVYQTGPSAILPLFDKEKAEFYGIFTLNGGEGVPISEIGKYEGWDFLVIMYVQNDVDKISKLLSDLKVPQEKYVFMSPTGYSCIRSKEFEDLLIPECREMYEWERGKEEYQSKILGDYSCLTVDGLSFINSASDTEIMGYMYFKRETYSKDNIESFIRIGNEKYTFSPKQDIFCDIGANIGTTSIYVKKKLENDIQILAFEPSKINYKLLKINMLLNDIDEADVELVNSAVSDSCGEARFKFMPQNPGGSSLIFEEDDEDTTVVELTTFDTYVEESGLDIERIKYIWIDIEGFEPAFFKGAEKTLSKINVPIIIEYSPSKYKKTGRYEEFLETLNRIYSRFIVFQEEGQFEHDISELSLYGEIAGQADIMLYK